MNGYDLALSGFVFVALPTGALYWPSERLLCVSDLHFGKSDRIARRCGTMLPPYETRDTLSRLESDLRATGATTVVLLGDSFDDDAAVQALGEDEQLWILRLQAGRRWIWIAGNHDPAPVELGGEQKGEFAAGPIIFRHIADGGATGEISGHYHPKAVLSARGRQVSRPCFLADDARIILPAFGTYTGGLRWSDPLLTDLMRPGARAVLTGRKAQCVPMPRTATVE